MAKKRKDKRQSGPEPTKEEKAVATYVRFNCPTKQTTVAGDEVHYFVGRKAVDALLESKWMLGKCKKGDPLFTNRSTAASYMQTLLEKGMFWRARKLVPRSVANKEQNKKNDDGKGTPKVLREKKANESGKENKVKGNEKEKEKNDKSEKEDDSKKKKKKVKLEFHPEQVFADAADVYVWHFDPVTWTKFLIGLGLVLASIALCLFPLWPTWTRQGVYYVSLGAMALLGFLLFLIVLRGIVFACVWLATRGKLHFWMLPNLTEDAGFFESFVPAYSYEYFGDSKDKDKDSDEDKNEDSDDENRDENGEEGQKSDDSAQEEQSDGEPAENATANQSSSEGADAGTSNQHQQASSTNDDNDNDNDSCANDNDTGQTSKLTRRQRARARRDSGGKGFEIVNSDDV